MKAIPYSTSKERTAFILSSPVMKLLPRLNIKRLMALVCLLFLAHAGSALSLAVDDPTTSGTSITNRAEATYSDDSGETYGTASPVVTVTVLAVAALNVTPDETESSAEVGPKERITRTFRICNTGNTPDIYTITRAEVNAPATLVNLYFDNDASNSVGSADALIHLNETLSSRVRPNACIGVLAVVDTNDSPANSNLTIRLTAHSNVQSVGGAQDDGTIINGVGSGPRITSPNDNSLPPVKMVNGGSQSIVSLGNPFAYTITFRNSGDTTARGVLVTDDLPTGIEYVSGTLQLGSKLLSDAEDADEGFVHGRQIVVQLAEVAPGQIVSITFKSRLSGNAPAATGLVNFANITGQNITPVKSSTAVVVIDPFGTVFSARAGGASPIPGSQVEILQQQQGQTLGLPLTGFAPNDQNSNPFTTGAQGRFSFALAPEQTGTESAPARYFVRVSANGYATRLIEVNIRPTRAGLYALAAHALDGQQLAGAGSFELVNSDVLIDDMAAVAFNIPMFDQRGLEISKSSDQQRVEIGDNVTYRIELHNPTAASVNDVVIQDHLPPSFHYAAGTGRLTLGNALERSLEPETNGDQITFRIGTLGPNASARLLYRVRVGANAREGQQENVAVGSGVFPSGEHTQTAPARATVTVGSGVFSTRQAIIGRVFVDNNGNGIFDDGDKPLAGIRLYLNNGQSVVTDSQGLYNFPSLGDGPQVLSLDPVSLPERYALADDGSVSSRSWTRLLRTPIGGGTLLHQNFVLIKNKNSQHAKGGETAADKNNSSKQSDASVALNANDKESGKSSAAQPSVSDSQQNNSAAENTPTAAGTYAFASNEVVEAVAPGALRVLSPSASSVVMSPAMQLEARVALDWMVRLEVNGHAVSDKNIGTSRLDQKNNVATYTFVGINLHPGPNTVRVTAVGPQGALGQTQELTVMGRGPARRLEIIALKNEIQSDGRDAATLRVRALDQWNSPALDDQVAVETTLGQLLRVGTNGAVDSSFRESQSTASNINDASASQSGGVRQPLAAEQVSRTQTQQLIVHLNGGEAIVKLSSTGAPGEARLHAQMGQLEARTNVRITPELRPAILVGLAQMTVGQSVPEVNLRGEEGNYRGRLSFFYSGRIGDKNLLTLSYDSQRPINRTAGRDRIFQLDPLDRTYPLFGDSSMRYEAAQSNSKLYARLDRNRSYAMFGDFDADMDSLALVGYTRKLTGVKLHAENSRGDFVTVTGARPDTSFTRDVFPAGGLSLMHLSHGEILPGSENVMLEVRDRRNPEIILSRETLVRSIDYNLNPLTGELFFLRYISAFDYDLNLVQLVATYEHRANSLSTAVYTTRARKNFNRLGLWLGFAGVMQRQAETGSFLLGGLDGEKTLPNKGVLRFAYARSQGEILGAGNFFETGNGQHNGNAYQVELVQPLKRFDSVVRARYSNASEGFLNPFGATVTPGSRRGEVSFQFKPWSRSVLQLGFTSERNKTVNVDNSRLTASVAWEQVLNERVRFRIGYDHRSLDDNLSGRTTDSNLVSAAAEVRVTDKLEISAKREQNLGEADPTYPNQTTLSATYQINQWAKLFFTQRLAAAPIMPIGDFSGAGFAATQSRHETAIGVESRVGKYTALVGRYQLENGINGTDSFAVMGLQNRLPINKELSLELGFERGFHLNGAGQSFNSATVGFGWQPNQDFRANARYEFRDRGGVGQLLAFGAAGRVNENVTALARLQWARTNFEGRDGSSLEGTAAVALRPVESDREALLLSYTHRSYEHDGADNFGPTRERADSLSADGYYQMTKALELSGRVALRLSANGQADLPYVSTFTYLTQGRVQYRLTSRLDWAGEARMIYQPSSATWRTSLGTELGFWVIPDMRLGVGYNFARAVESQSARTMNLRRGFYFTITSKLSNLFDLLGTQQNGFAGSGKDQTDQNNEKK